MDSLNRFVNAQASSYENALSEIKNGRKTSHWMWYIFPQIKGLGHSETARHFALEDKEEAEQYLNHPILGTRLVNISKELLKHKGQTANQIFGFPDDLKLHSSMTLFSILPDSDPIFKAILSIYFHGLPDQKTVEIVNGKFG